MVRARNNVNVNFKLTIENLAGDTVFFRDLNLDEDFDNQGGGNEQTDWYSSRFELKDLWGQYLVRFDWYDHIGDPGILGAFTFATSTLDFTAPEWYYVSIGSITVGTDIMVLLNEDASIYLVPSETAADAESIDAAAVSRVEVNANVQANLPTLDIIAGDYLVYAIDIAGNISDPSGTVTSEYL